MGTFTIDAGELSVDYKIHFDLTSIPKLEVTDSSTYPSTIDNVVISIKITRPDNIVRNPGEGGDIVGNSDELPIFSYNLPIDANTAKVPEGLYIIDYTLAVGEDNITVTKQIEFDFTYLELTTEQYIDEFTPELKIKDTTPNYTVTNYTLKNILRKFTTTNSISGSNIDVKTSTGFENEDRFHDLLDTNSNYHDTKYSHTTEVICNHEHSTFSWFSVSVALSKEEKLDAYAPPTKVVMLSYFDTLRNLMETYDGYNTDLYEKYKKDYEFVISSWSHLEDRITAEDTSKDSTEILRDILDVLRRNIPRPHTNEILTPLKLSDFAPSANWNTIINIPTYNPFATYEKAFPTPSVEWEIIHSLNKKPSVTLVDDYENIVYGAVEYVNLNIIKITFNSITSGKAYLN